MTIAVLLTKAFGRIELQHHTSFWVCMKEARSSMQWQVCIAPSCHHHVCSASCRLLLVAVVSAESSPPGGFHGFYLCNGTAHSNLLNALIAGAAPAFLVKNAGALLTLCGGSARSQYLTILRSLVAGAAPAFFSKNAGALLTLCGGYACSKYLTICASALLPQHRITRIPRDPFLVPAIPFLVPAGMRKGMRSA